MVAMNGMDEIMELVRRCIASPKDAIFGGTDLLGGISYHTLVELTDLGEGATGLPGLKELREKMNSKRNYAPQMAKMIARLGELILEGPRLQTKYEQAEGRERLDLGAALHANFIRIIVGVLLMNIILKDWVKNGTRMVQIKDLH